MLFEVSLLIAKRGERDLSAATLPTLEALRASEPNTSADVLCAYHRMLEAEHARRKRAN